MSIKSRLIDLLKQGNAEIHTYINHLNEAELNEVGKEDYWSTKDNIAHLTEWLARMVQNMDAARNNQPIPNYDHIDTANAEIFAQYYSLPWEQVMQKMDQAFQDTQKEIEALSEDELQKTDYYNWQQRRPLWQTFVGNVYTHPMSHLGQVATQHGYAAYAIELHERAAQLMNTLDDSPAWQGVTAYNLGCIYALAGEKQKALQQLRQGLSLYPSLLPWSKQDTDLASLHADPDFLALIQSLETI